MKKLTEVLLRSSLEYPIGAALVLAGSALLLGALITAKPVFAWGLLIAVAGAAASTTDPRIWALAAVAAAIGSRLLVSFGAPAALNFVHYPLAFAGAMLAALRDRSNSDAARTVGIPALLLLLLCLFSTAVNGGEPLRPILTWLVFCEPMLIAYSFAALGAGSSDRMWRFLLGLALIQIPFALMQFVTLGGADFVQGTFVDQSTGAHAVSAVCLLGSLVYVGKALSGGASRSQTPLFAAAAALIVIPIIADGKQVIVAFVPAFALIVVGSRLRLERVILPAVFVTVVLAAGVMLSGDVWANVSSNQVAGGLNAKFTGTKTLIRKMNDAPVSWVLGFGPGNSVSRVAILTSPAIVKQQSPLATLGLSTAQVTAEIINENFAMFFAVGSSAWSVFSSWLSLLGDIGLLGVGLYLWSAVATWRALKARPGWDSSVAVATLPTAALLGIIYTWLEEPGYVVYLGAIIGIALAKPRGPATDPSLAYSADDGVAVTLRPQDPSRPADFRTPAGDFPASRETRRANFP